MYSVIIEFFTLSKPNSVLGRYRDIELIFDTREEAEVGMEKVLLTRNDINFITMHKVYKKKLGRGRPIYNHKDIVAIQSERFIDALVDL